jgi:hypothetical protein
MHAACICGDDHPACVDDEDEDTWKMNTLATTKENDLVTCPMCRNIINWDPNDY